MELKTNVHAENNQQDLTITRAFDLPVDLLFKAFAEPDLMEQWMGTRVLKLKSKKHGSYQFETTNKQGKVVFRANGVIHTFSPNKQIIRTFEMENTSFGVQLEILGFDKLTENTSRLKKHVIYESAVHRDENLKLPFSQGINMAHNRLQEILTTD